MVSFSQSLSHEYPQGDAPFRQAETFGPQPVPRDYLDALRMNWRRTPEAQYPDGYLGTIKTRREDRMLNSLKRRMNNRPYTRGIHKGERIDTTDYFWPEEFGFFSGLAMQATAEFGDVEMGSYSNGWAAPRWVPPGLGMDLEYERYPTDRKVGPKRLPNGGVSTPTRAEMMADTDRRSQLLQFAPSIASGGTRGNPGMALGYSATR